MMTRLLPCLPLLLLCVLSHAVGTTAAPDTVVEGRINGGENAQPGRYPYTVSLQSLSAGIRHLCGGSLIAPDIILTAAHCIEPLGRLEDLAVRVGPFRLREPIEGSEIFPIVDIAFHPQYESGSFVFDVMLLKLDGASFNRTLVTLNNNPSLPFVDQSLTAMGWGDVADRQGSAPDALQVTDANVYIDTDMCNELFVDVELGVGFPFNDNVMCVLEPAGVGVCSGDSGGPLIIPGTTPEEDIQVGIASFVVGCRNPRYPSGFARVSFFQEFIRTNLCRLSDYPPDSFDCQNIVTATPSSAPVDSTVSSAPTPSVEQTYITIRIYLAFDSDLVSWMIETLDGEVLFEIPEGTYNGPRYNFVTETVSVPPGTILNFIFSAGEGSVTQPLGPPPNDIANIFLGDTVDFNKTIARVNTDASLGLDITTSFVVSEAGIIPQDALIAAPTPAPTAMVPPSLIGLPQVNTTLVIDFDTYPTETRWRIQYINGGRFAAYGGPYSPSVGSSITETITLLEGAKYRFWIGDQGGDGMCCLRGNGNVRMYLGNEVDDTAVLFVEDGVFGELSTTTFTVSANNTFTATKAPTVAPTVTNSPTTPFEITVTIFLDSSEHDTSWAIMDANAEIYIYEGYVLEDFATNITETVVVDAGQEYTFVIFDSYGDGIFNGFGAVTVGSSYAEDRVLAFIDGESFQSFGSTKFTASLDAVIPGGSTPSAPVAPIAAPIIFSPALPFSPSGSDFTASPVAAPSISATPTTSSQTIVTVVVKFPFTFPFRDGHTYGLTIETVGTGDQVFEATDVASNDPSSLIWSRAVVLESGVEYLLTITDSRGNGFNDEVGVYLGREPSRLRTLLVMEGPFGFVRKQLFVADLTGFILSNSPSTVPTSPPSGAPSVSSLPTSAPSISSDPTMTAAPSGPPTAVLIMFVFDQYASEVSWSLMDIRDTIVASVESPSYEGQGVAAQVLSLNVGSTYVLTVSDSASDGICCAYGNGYFFLFLGDTPDRAAALVFDNGQYGASATHTFTVSEASLLPAQDIPDSPIFPDATVAPVTVAPVASAPVTSAPVTIAPVTAAPITAAPISRAPVTAAPITQVPVTTAPISRAPITNAPVVAGATTPAPTTAAPAVAAGDVTPSPTVAATPAPTTAPPTSSAVSLSASILTTLALVAIGSMMVCV